MKSTGILTVSRRGGFERVDAGRSRGRDIAQAARLTTLRNRIPPEVIGSFGWTHSEPRPNTC